MPATHSLQVLQHQPQALPGQARWQQEQLKQLALLLQALQPQVLLLLPVLPVLLVPAHPVLLALPAAPLQQPAAPAWLVQPCQRCSPWARAALLHGTPGACPVEGLQLQLLPEHQGQRLEVPQAPQVLLPAGA